MRNIYILPILLGLFCVNGCAKRPTNTAPGECDPSSCLGCCLNGQCMEGKGNSACGKNGVNCSACDKVGGTCDVLAGVCSNPGGCTSENCGGCCDGQHCRQGVFPEQCGAGGVACAACSERQTCEVVSTGGQCTDIDTPDTPGTCPVPDCSATSGTHCFITSDEHAVEQCVPIENNKFTVNSCGSVSTASLMYRCGYDGKCYKCVGPEASPLLAGWAAEADQSKCTTCGGGTGGCTKDNDDCQDSLGKSGKCLAGSCCTGCLTDYDPGNGEPVTTRCITGTSKLFCGKGGDACKTCSGTNMECAATTQVCQCAGCLDATGQCTDGKQNTACGKGGQACQNCRDTDRYCLVQQCKTGSSL